MVGYVFSAIVVMGTMSRIGQRSLAFLSVKEREKRAHEK